MEENTSVKQSNFKELKAQPKGKKGPKRLFLDLDICSTTCPECVVKCSYFYHPDNIGITSVRELATHCVICRKCDEPHCVNSCKYDALEKQEDNVLVRYGMRCVSCKSCSHACPYGTIYPELVPHAFQNCDFCLDRRGEKDDPICIPTCPYGALSIKEGDFNLDENTFLVGANLLVHSTHWMREKA
jgi:Fe-S-cluster-containing dehydrogenase component